MFVVASGRSVLSEIKEYRTEYSEGIIVNYDIILATEDSKALKVNKAGEAMMLAVLVNQQINSNSFRIFEINE